MPDTIHRTGLSFPHARLYALTGVPIARAAWDEEPQWVTYESGAWMMTTAEAFGIVRAATLTRADFLAADWKLPGCEGLTEIPAPLPFPTDGGLDEDEGPRFDVNAPPCRVVSRVPQAEVDPVELAQPFNLFLAEIELVSGTLSDSYTATLINPATDQTTECAITNTLTYQRLSESVLELELRSTIACSGGFGNAIQLSPGPDRPYTEGLRQHKGRPPGSSGGVPVVHVLTWEITAPGLYEIGWGDSVSAATFYINGPSQTARDYLNSVAVLRIV